MDPRFDDLLHTIIVEKGQGIYGFLDVVFGFMYRRTDFYYEMAPGENMGFFPGQADALVYNYIKKYKELHYKEKVPKRNIDPKEIEEFMNKHKQKKEEKQVKEIKSDKEVKADRENKEIEKYEEKRKDQDGIVDLNNISKDKTKQSESIENKLKLDSIEKAQEVKLKPNTEVKFNPISTYNGDSCDEYNWSQGTTDVQIQIKLPTNSGAKKVSNYI